MVRKDVDWINEAHDGVESCALMNTMRSHPGA
jgi:hypothetical protein